MDSDAGGGHPRRVPAAGGRFPRRARGGPRRRADERDFSRDIAARYSGEIFRRDMPARYSGEICRRDIPARYSAPWSRARPVPRRRLGPRQAHQPQAGRASGVVGDTPTTSTPAAARSAAARRVNKAASPCQQGRLAVSTRPPPSSAPSESASSESAERPRPRSRRRRRTTTAPPASGRRAGPVLEASSLTRDSEGDGSDDWLREEDSRPVSLPGRVKAAARVTAPPRHAGRRDPRRGSPWAPAAARGGLALLSVAQAQAGPDSDGWLVRGTRTVARRSRGTVGS